MLQLRCLPTRRPSPAAQQPYGELPQPKGAQCLWSLPMPTQTLLQLHACVTCCFVLSSGQWQGGAEKSGKGSLTHTLTQAWAQTDKGFFPFLCVISGDATLELFQLLACTACCHAASQQCLL